MKYMGKYLILVLCIFTISISASVKHITLLGSLHAHNIEAMDGLPLVYKGCEYDVRVEIFGEKKKAYFELYDEEKPRILYLIVTEYLKQPEENNIEHLCTSSDHPYRIFKLTRSLDKTVVLDLLQLINLEAQETWLIEELDNSIKNFKIPDNTVIVFMPSTMLDHIEPVTSVNVGTTLTLPTLVFKAHDTTQLKDITARMKLAFLDFKLLHKKPYKAFVPCANNHILSMPFTPRAHS